MKLAAIAIAATALFAAGAASAGDVTDVAYLQANRCKGLATGVNGVVDADAISAFVKASSGSRSNYVMERADHEFGKAKREARRADKSRITAELTGPCSAFLGSPADYAKRSSLKPNS